jgi:plastocyanin
VRTVRNLGLFIVVVVLAACSGAASPATSTAPASVAPASVAPASVASPAASASPNASPSAAGGGGGSTLAVSIVDFAFNPASITAKVGEKVTWTHQGDATHTVTFDDGEDSGSLGKGDTFERTFDAAGSYPYKCKIHPAMKGTVEVSA